MPRTMVGPLSAVGAAMFALVGLVHGGLILVLVIIALAAAVTGLADYLALPPIKKTCRVK